MAKTPKIVRPVLYRHTSHAEWGHGVIVEENAAKVYLAFEDGGRRPFVNVQRYRELLVPAELESAAADEVVAKIAKGAAKPAPKAAAKKSKKKVAAAEVEAVEEARDEEGDDSDEDSASDED